MWSISPTVDEFVDNTNRFVWRNLQCKVWDKVSEGSTAVMATSEFPFIIAKATRYIIGERNLVCQTPARSFSYFDKISACGRRTDGRTDRQTHDDSITSRSKKTKELGSASIVQQLDNVVPIFLPWIDA